VPITTATLAYGAVEKRTTPLGKTSVIHSVETDRAARVRLYATSTQRDADESRAMGALPIGNHGLILEAITSTAETLNVTPSVIAHCATSDVPLSVTNLATSSAVVVTFASIQLEA
jgi:hypothetical protein